tara:strand:+ start:154 stop:450 length:297 start_codon:yes stop_codon:yes gene_type:complete
MTNKNINYQQIYEDQLTDAIRSSLELPRGYYELSHQQRMMIEEMIDAGYRRAVEDALDPVILNDTAALAAEMGTQLYNFANVLGDYLKDIDALDDEEV